jgi:endoglucanase
VGVAASGPAHALDSDIRLSSIGYLPDRAKVASVVVDAGGLAGTEFVVRPAAGGAPVLRSKLTAARKDADTGQSVKLADFSAVTDEGSYVLEVPGVGQTLPFRIAKDAYKRSYTLAMLGFYGWRAGTDVSLTVDGITWKHAAGHPDDAYLDYLGQPGKKRDATGGWYDAGDYGKYVVNAAMSVGNLLFAWEHFKPTLSAVPLPIPEQGGDLPDFLDELKWETDWLLKMQYPEDGRVSHKISSLGFGGFVLPEKDTAKRFFVPSGTNAVASFVATLAKAARAFEPYDAAYAKRCLDAAKRSYAWLRAHPKSEAAEQTAFTTGRYDTADGDDRLWAAAEMFESTGDSEALQDFEARAGALRELVEANFDWDHVQNLGVFTYLASERTGRNPDLVQKFETALVARADAVVKIGIGAPDDLQGPLPHHPACGSAPGGSKS